MSGSMPRRSRLPSLKLQAVNSCRGEALAPARTGGGPTRAASSPSQLGRRHSWSMAGLQRISPQPRSPRSPSDAGGLPPPSPRFAAQQGAAVGPPQWQHRDAAPGAGGAFSQPVRTASTPPKYPGGLTTARSGRSSGAASSRPPTPRSSSSGMLHDLINGHEMQPLTESNDLEILLCMQSFEFLGLCWRYLPPAL